MSYFFCVSDYFQPLLAFFVWRLPKRAVYTSNNGYDLMRLQMWESRWQMEFNVKKCSILTVSNKRHPTPYTYKLHGQTLHVKSAKYLGVEFSHNLKWNKHIAQIASKANKTSAFLTRNLKGCQISTQALAFKTIVRPILEYASIVWDPHYKKDAITLEKCQKRAARRITNTFSPYSSASDLTKRIGLENLSTRRKKNKIKMFHAIYNNKTCLKLPDNIRQANKRTRGHSEKLTIPPARTNTHIQSFFPSTVRLWNNLPAEAVENSCPENFNQIVKHVILASQ